MVAVPVHGPVMYLNIRLELPLVNSLLLGTVMYALFLKMYFVNWSLPYSVFFSEWIRLDEPTELIGVLRALALHQAERFKFKFRGFKRTPSNEVTAYDSITLTTLMNWDQKSNYYLCKCPWSLCLSVCYLLPDRRAWDMETWMVPCCHKLSGACFKPLRFTKTHQKSLKKAKPPQRHVVQVRSKLVFQKAF